MSNYSVLMCVYEKDIDNAFIDAIDSLLPNKKYIKETIIVINGFISEVKRKKIETEINNLKIIKVELPINVGISRALNIGLKRVSSDWVVRFDSDDICASNRFEIINKTIKKIGPEYDVIGTYIEEFDSESDQKIIRKVPLRFEDIKKNILFSNPMNHVSVFFKTSLIKEIKEDYFYPIIDGFEDYALWIKLIFRDKKFINIPINTVYVRADNEMLKRRGGLNYICREIKFRSFVFEYIGIMKYPQNIIFGFLRIFIFMSPIFIKKIFYKIKRNYF